MNSKKYPLIVVALMLMTAMSLAGPIGAVSLYDSLPEEAPKCIESVNGEAVITSPPAAAFGVNWELQCVIINPGDTVRFVNADPIPHQPGAAGCFDLGRLGAGAEGVVALDLSGTDVLATFDPVGIVPTTTKLCEEGATTQIRDPGVGPFASGASSGDVVEDDGDFVNLRYICFIHDGGQMTGVIKIRK